mgnify:CR=1 FL=1
MPDPRITGTIRRWEIRNGLGKEQDEEKSRDNMDRAGSRSDLFLLAEGDRDRDSVHIS